MRKIVAPLALLASITLLTSCTKEEQAPVVPAVSTETPAAVQPVTPVEMTPSTMSSGSTGTTIPVTQTSPITRTEVVTYDSRSPEGMVPVEFSVTVTDGVITAASATPKTELQASLYNQTNFAKGVSAAVVGKKAKDLDVDAIGGSSLTTNAFEMFVHSF